jgi:glycerol-3-phosphate dehydrogenase
LASASQAWTAGACLPGGNFPADGFDALVEQLQTAHGWLDRNTAQRLVRHYGTRAKDVLGGCAGVADAGAVAFGFGLREAEVRYLVENEWARQQMTSCSGARNSGIRFQCNPS